MTTTPILFQSALIHTRTTQRSLLETRFNEGRLSGREMHGAKLSYSGERLTPLSSLPAAAVVVASLQTDDYSIVHATHPLGSMLVCVTAKTAEVTISSPTIETCEQLLAEVRALVPSPEDAASIPVGFWSVSDGDAKRRTHRIDAMPWEQIQRNYPLAVRRQLDHVMALQPPFDGGRLIMFHGEPGTGKTNAIRSLIHAWSDWCSAQFITEPEAFFGRTQYLDTVVNAIDGLTSGPTVDRSAVWNTPWKLIIAEDTDELLHSATNHQSGGALGRLFNMADGILGQGARAIYLITTNEPVHQLHPALLRPGRCLSRIEFERFDVTEGRAWMPDAARHTVTDRLTLAELYEQRGDHERIQHLSATPGYGTYL